MPAVSLKELPEYVSTEAVGWVMAWHHEAARYWVSSTGAVQFSPAPAWSEIGSGVVHPAVPVSSRRVALGADEDTSPAHLEELFSRTRDQRLKYLADAGMANCKINALVLLVQDWLDDTELARLESLSQAAVDEGLEVSDLFRRWINWHGQLRLALALSSKESPFSDFGLAAAYALCHAVTLASASYRADRVGRDPLPVAVAGDELG
jgi:hypothetical protein